MIEVRRAADRTRSEHAGITTWHCFSAGAHYDPANVAFGSVIGVDEHLIAPGAGFDWHAHAGVVIVSWVLEGALRHEDDDGTLLVIEPGQVLVQAIGDGIRHAEHNASGSVPLRFVQTTLLRDAPRSVTVTRPPAAGFHVVRNTASPLDQSLSGPSDDSSRGEGGVLPGGSHAFVARGSFAVGDTELEPGDSIRAAEAVAIRGAGEMLVVHGE